MNFQEVLKHESENPQSTFHLVEGDMTVCFDQNGILRVCNGEDHSLFPPKPPMLTHSDLLDGTWLPVTARASSID